MELCFIVTKRYSIVMAWKACMSAAAGNQQLDDQQFLMEVFAKLDYPNQVLYFGDGEAALQYLNGPIEPPSLILSDINMPKLDGLALRLKPKTDAALQLKCIPYFFFSTALNQKTVIDAYSMSVQGFCKAIFHV